MIFGRLRNTLCADLRGGTERGQMVRSTGLTAGFQIGATALAFGASLVYARALGPHDYGLYVYVMSWALILTVAADLGIPAYVTREGAKFPANLRWMQRWGDKRLLVSGVVAAILMAAAWFIPEAAGARWLFVVGAFIPLLNSLSDNRRAAMRARGAVARGQWPDMLAAPALMLAALGGLWAVRGDLHPLDLMLAMLGACVVKLLINERQLRSLVGGPYKPPMSPIRLRAALPFMWLGGLYLLNNRVALVMLGALNGAHDAGIYAIAARAAGLVAFVAGAANLVLAPRIARLHHAGDHQLLQRMVTAAARRVLIASVPLALLLVIAAWWLLDLLYGAAFTPAARPLQILAVAQLVAIGFGSVGTLLNMAGHERESMMGLALAVVLNIVLNAILIPRLGAMGAAIATGSSSVLAQALLWAWVRRRLRIRPTAFGV